MYLTLQALPCFWYASSMAAFMYLPMAGRRLFLTRNSQHDSRNGRAEPKWNTLHRTAVSMCALKQPKTGHNTKHESPADQRAIHLQHVAQPCCRYAMQYRM